MRTILCLVALCLFAACGRPEPTPARPDAITDTPPPVHDETDGSCGGPPQDPACPLNWTGARALCFPSTPCSSLGTSCWYPDSGDQLPDGTWAAALLLCTDLHGSSDAGAGEWTCAQ